MPPSVKFGLAWEDPRSNRGFVQQGRERVTQATSAAEITAMREKAPDCKETMEIGRDWDATWRNMWPREGDCPGFKQTMLEFFRVRIAFFLLFRGTMYELIYTSRLAMSFTSLS